MSLYTICETIVQHYIAYVYRAQGLAPARKKYDPFFFLARASLCVYVYPSLYSCVQIYRI